MAAEQAAEGKPRPSQRPVLTQRLHCILAARGREAARGRRQRRYATLVETDGQDEQLCQESAYDFQLNYWIYEGLCSFLPRIARIARIFPVRRGRSLFVQFVVVCLSVAGEAVRVIRGYSVRLSWA